MDPNDISVGPFMRLFRR